MDTQRMLMQNGDTVTLCPKEGRPTAFLVQGVCAESGTAVTYHVLRRSDDGDVSGFLTELYPTDGIRGGEEQFFAMVRLPDLRLVPAGGTVRRFGTYADAFTETAESLRGHSAAATPLLAETVKGMELLEGVPELPRPGVSRTLTVRYRKPTRYVWTPDSGVSFESHLSTFRKNAETAPDEKLTAVLTRMKEMADAIALLEADGLYLPALQAGALNVVKEGERQVIRLVSLASLLRKDTPLPLPSADTDTAAPELAQGTFDARTDVYALGALLFRCLVIGNAPERYDPSFYEDLSQRVQSSLLIRSSLAHVRQDLRGTLVELLEKSLAPSPGDRYADAKAFAERLGAAIALMKADAAQELSADAMAAIAPAHPNEQPLEPAMSELLLIQKHLYDHPLYEALGDEKDLKVLIVAAGAHWPCFLDLCLQAGQMKDIRLHVTVLSDTPDEAKRAYLAGRRDLLRFVDVGLYGEGLPETYDPEQYAQINFTLPSILRGGVCPSLTTTGAATRAAFRDIIGRMHGKYHYAFVDSAQVKAGETIAGAIASATKEAGRRCTVTLVTRSPRKAARSYHLLWISAPLYRSELDSELVRMAFNTDRVWGGMFNVDMEKERKAFVADSYRFLSSLSFVTTIPSKLYSLGYRGTLAEMAARYEDEIVSRRHDTDSPEGRRAAETFRQIAAIEHRRWVLEKVTDNWYAPMKKKKLDLTKFVEAGSTHDKTLLIHCCLVKGGVDTPLQSPAYTENGHEKWDKPIDPALDPLDRMSLALHQRYVKKAKEVRQSDPLNSEDMRGLMIVTADANERITAAMRRFHACVDDLVKSVPVGRSVLDRTADDLKAALKTMPKAVAEKAVLHVQGICQMMKPIVESTHYCDYKDIDSRLLESIPFILTYTHTKRLALAFEDASRDNGRSEAAFSNVAPVLALGPREIHYLYDFTPGTDLSCFKDTFSGLLCFLGRRPLKTKVWMTVTCRAEVSEAVRDDLRAFLEKASQENREAIEHVDRDAPNVTFLAAPVFSVADAADAADCFVKTIVEHGASLYEGSAPLFRSPSETALFLAKLHEAGVAYLEFDWRRKRFVNCVGCEYLYHVQDASYLRVEDIFALRGSVVSKRFTADFMEDHRRLWAIYSNNGNAKGYAERVNGWNRMCKLIESYRKNKRTMISLPLGRPSQNSEEDAQGKGQNEFWYLPIYTKPTLQRLMKLLIDHGAVDRASSVVVHTSDTCCFKVLDATDRLICQLKALFADPTLLLPYYGMTFTEQNGSLECAVGVLTVEKLLLADDGDALYPKAAPILEALEEARCISGLTFDSSTGDTSMRDTASFRICSPDMAALLSSGGQILEIYAYYESLRMGYFDDVACSYDFRWADEAVENELDLVLTKGFKTIFVECKAVKLLEQGFYHKLDSIASTFGIDTYKVLLGDLYDKPNSKRNRIQVKRGEQIHIRSLTTQESVKNVAQELIDLIK